MYIDESSSKIPKYFISNHICVRMLSPKVFVRYNNYIIIFDMS